MQTLISCYKGKAINEYVEKHEEVKVPMLTLFINIAEYAPYDILEQIFGIFKNCPLNAYTEILLKALCYYTVAALKNVQKRNKELEKQKNSNKGLESSLDINFSFCDLDTIWNIMTYSKSDINIKIKDLAISCLIKISEQSESITKDLVTKAFKSIFSNEGYAIRSMKFLIICYRHLKKKWALKKWYKVNNDILNTLINNLNTYKEKVIGEAKKGMSFVCSLNCY